MVAELGLLVSEEGCGNRLVADHRPEDGDQNRGDPLADGCWQLGDSEDHIDDQTHDEDGGGEEDDADADQLEVELPAPLGLVGVLQPLCEVRSGDVESCLEFGHFSHQHVHHEGVLSGATPVPQRLDLLRAGVEPVCGVNELQAFS